MTNTAQYTEKTSRGSLPAGGLVVCSSDGSAEISVKDVLDSHDIEPLETRFIAECVCGINKLIPFIFLHRQYGTFHDTPAPDRHTSCGASADGRYCMYTIDLSAPMWHNIIIFVILPIDTAFSK